MEMRILFSRGVQFTNLESNKIIQSEKNFCHEFNFIDYQFTLYNEIFSIRAKFENGKLAFDDLIFSQLALIDGGQRGGVDTRDTSGPRNKGETRAKYRNRFTRPSTFLAKT